jgi:S-adenosylmethionine decarboxylase
LVGTIDPYFALPTVHAASGVVGRHCIFELQDGNPNLLDNEDFIKTALTKAADAAGATLLGLVSHKFEPQGVTAIALLSESHISIHTWPEQSYAAIDCFSCGDHTNPESACRSLKDDFEAKSGAMQILNRRNAAFNHAQSLGGAVR